MTEHSTFLPASLIRVRFDPVLELLDELEREYGPGLRFEIIDEAMRLYTELTPVMDRLMEHRGKAEVIAYGWVRREQFTFSVVLSYDEMVITDIYFGFPSLPDPDRIGGSGFFEVRLGSARRRIKMRTTVTQPSSAAATVIQPTAGTAQTADPGLAQTGSPVTAIADASADQAVPRRQLGLRRLLLEVFQIITKPRAGNIVADRSSKYLAHTSIIAGHIIVQSLNAVLSGRRNVAMVEGNHRYASIVSLLRKFTTEQNIQDTNDHCLLGIRSFVSFNENTSCNHSTPQASELRQRLFLRSDHLHTCVAVGSDHPGKKNDDISPRKPQIDFADVTAWLVNVHDEPLRTDVARGNGVTNDGIDCDGDSGDWLAVLQLYAVTAGLGRRSDASAAKNEEGADTIAIKSD